MSRKHRGKIPRNNREYESFLDALAVLKTARNLHLPRSAAAEIEGVPEKTVERYTRSAWRKRGRDFVPKPDDRIPRTVQLSGLRGWRFMHPATRERLRYLESTAVREANILGPAITQT
jgi:hypothetical protein